MVLAKSWWTQDHESSNGAWLYLSANDGEFEASVKWDGCVNLCWDDEVYGATVSMDLHICDLDAFIERLKEIKLHALPYFGDTEWPACAPNIPAK